MEDQLQILNNHIYLFYEELMGMVVFITLLLLYIKISKSIVGGLKITWLYLE